MCPHDGASCKALFLNLRPCLEQLHFTSEAVLEGFGSINSFIGGARAILINCLTKQVLS